MKKSCIIFLLSIIISLTAIGFVGGLTSQTTCATEYIRIHIRANSNAKQDQDVKYLVKDEVVDFLTPVVAECPTREDAQTALKNHLTGVERTARRVLQREGFSYGASACVKVERFPTRAYGEYVLEEGEYLALILELGGGTGDNWWCVVYPPLCFAGNSRTQILYRSKIAEIIQNWRKKS